MLKWLFPLIVFAVAVTACSPATVPTPTPAVPTAAPTRPASSTAAATKPPAATTAPTKAVVQPLSPPVTVKIGGTGAIPEAFLSIADARGYIAEEGLKADFIKFRSASEMIAPLGTGELDVGGGSPNPALFNSIARGIPLKIVADRSSSRPGRADFALLVRKDLIDTGQVKSLSDLKGKTVAVSGTGTAAEITLEKALTQAGLKREDINIVSMGFPDMLTAFGGKAIDMAMSVEPYNTVGAENGTAVRWKGEDELYPNHEPSVLLYGSNFWQNNPEAAKRLMVAYIRGIRDFLDAMIKNTNRSEVVAILTKSTTITDPSLWGKMVIGGVNPDGAVNTQSISADQDWYLSKGLIQQKLEMTKVVDDEYVQYALDRLGKYQP